MYIGLPSLQARYEILSSCIQELIRVGIIHSDEILLPWKMVMELLQESDNSAIKRSVMVFETSERCEGFSGRALRKIPFLAHALFIQVII